MKKLPLPEQSFLRGILNYDSQTGNFVWIAGHRRGLPAGQLRPCGYIGIQICGVRYFAHRLAWVWTHGIEIGDLEIDHIDRNRSNNAINNLRLATSSQQNQNKTVHPYSSSQLKGAFRNKVGKPWRSAIRIGGKIVHLGMFDTAEDAHAAYAKAAQYNFGEFARIA